MDYSWLSAVKKKKKTWKKLVGKGYNCQLKQTQFSNLNPWSIIYF